MKKLLFSFFFIIFFSNLNANEIDLNDPYYKIGWKNLENPENTSIIIPDANASIEIVESEIYLDSKENIKKRLDLIREQETNIEDIYEKLIIFDREEYYKVNVEYSDVGYITSDRFKNFTASDIAEVMYKRMSNSISKVSWLIEPNLSENNTSTFAYKIEWLDGDITYEYKSLILGREGYIELTIMLYGDGNESKEFFDYYSGIIKAITSSVKFNDGYGYSDFQKDDYISSNTLTNLIDKSYGMGIATDPTNHVAYCLISTSDLKISKITEADYPRFAGKVINFYVSDVKEEIADISEDDEVNVLSGMYGLGDKQIFKKTEVYTNAYSVAYTNIIELKGDKEGDKVKYEYKNKLQFENGKPVRLFAYIDQTGFSISKWTLKLNCRDYDYTTEEKLEAKKYIPNSNLLKRSTNGEPPPYFFELVEKMKNLEGKGKTEKTTENEIIIRNWKKGSQQVNIDRGALNYSILREEDGEDFMVIYRYLNSSSWKGSIVYDTKSQFSKFFEKVYIAGQRSKNTSTSIQPNKLNNDSELESYLSPEYILDDFNYTFNRRMGDYILNFETLTGMERITSYISNKESFSLATLLESGVGAGTWHASTYIILSDIDDYIQLAKNNPSTVCKILWEPLLKDLINKELNTVKIEEELNKKGINKDNLGCK